jgi:competence ComEA-like helix-hairpin-helix protein
MKKHRRIVFLLTAEQWIGVVILVALVIGTLVLIRYCQPKKEVVLTWTNDSVKSEFVDYQLQQDSVRKEEWKKKYKRDTIAILMQDFDPNTADSSTLVHLGLKPWQAKNILKYRAAGGRYRKAEDIKKLYGMTDSMYHALEPYICIAVVDTVDSVKLDTMRVDTFPRWKSDKKDTVLNIRTADTTELKMIRGIGSYRARQIVRYREQLGGFARVEQVLEAKGMEHMADSVLNSFVLDSVVIDSLNINRISVQRLSKHPYLRFEQAKAIYELRRKYVRLDSIEQLYELDCLSPETIQKITPYLNFDKNN